MPKPTPTPDRHMRADARHNYELILRVALEVFTERGYEVSIAEVARRSGLGMGTIYRHFENKSALVERIAAAAMREMQAEVERTLDQDPGSWSSFTHVARHLVRRRSSQLLAPLGGSAGENGHELMAARTDLLTVLDDLVTRTQEAGLLRADINAVDLVLLVDSIPPYRPVPSGSTDLADRHLGVILDGLRQQDSETLPLPAPGRADIDYYYRRTRGL